jgi:Response regulator containing a CheY-like receiver domain and an HTH DNA-binding domain
MIPDFKDCPRCKKLGRESWHCITNFYKDGRKKDKHRTNCKECDKEQQGDRNKRKKETKTARTSLTHHQIKILYMVAGGVANKNIAEAIGISPDIVTGYIYKIRRTLGLPNREAMMALSSEEIKSFQKSHKEPSLTQREREIAILVTHGYTNDQIARKLQPRITEGSVEQHMKKIFEKLGLFSRVELAIYALKIGIIKLDGIKLNTDQQEQREETMRQ